MQLMLVGSVLLLIDSFLDWQAVDDFPGISAWHGFLGVVMGLLTIVLIAWLVARIAGVDIPIPASAAMIGAVLAGLILLFAVLKNLTDDFSTIWSYVGIVLAAVIAFGAWMIVQESGGYEQLRSEMPSSSSRTAVSDPPAPAAPPPPAPAAPPPPAPEPDVTPDDRPDAERT